MRALILMFAVGFFGFGYLAATQQNHDVPVALALLSLGACITFVWLKDHQ